MILLLALRWLAIALLGGGSGAALAIVWCAATTPDCLATAGARFDRDLAFIRASFGARPLLATQATVCLLGLAFARVLASPWPLAGVALAICAPGPWLTHLRAARVTQLDLQLDPWLVALANTLRATPSLGEALGSTIATTAPPLRDELDLLLKEYRLGTPLDSALDNAARRIGGRAFTALVLTLQVARSSGGGVSECLERAAATLREMSRLDGVVRTKTAEGKTQAVVIAVLPGPFFALLAQLDPDFLRPLSSTATGHAVLAAALALWLVAVLFARRIVQVDI